MRMTAKQLWCWGRKKWNCILLWLLLWVCGIWVGCGCAGPTAAPQEIVSSLRILGIRAEPPEVRPGDTIRLAALVGNPSHADFRWQWYACRKPSQASSGCAEEGDAVSLGQQAETIYQVPQNFFPEKPSLLDLFRGVYLPITLVVQAQGDRNEAFKRVVVSRFPANQNPTFADLKWFEGEQKEPQATPWSFKPGVSYRMEPVVATGSQQEYFLLSPDGNLEPTQETMYISWYVTHGTLRGGLRSESPQLTKWWIAPQEIRGIRDVTLFALLRDGRGGIHWLQRTIVLQP